MAVDLLNISKSGLMASKKSLETTGHNIANVNTEGYSRQRVQQSTNYPVGSGKLVHGTGVRVDGIKRVHDQHVEKRLRDQFTETTYYKSSSDILSQVENIFNEIDSEGLNKLLNKFFNSFRQLANQPENETIRSIVRENAKQVTKDFNRVYETLSDVNDQIGHDIKRSTQEINQLLHSIAHLNKRISELENIHGETGDLRDQRDNEIRRLSEYFNVHTYLDEKSRYVVHIEGLGGLVSGDMVQELMAGATPKDKSTNKLEGSVELYLKNRPLNPLSTNIKKGKIAGLFNVRNKNILNLMNRMDELAFHLANSINSIHRKGYANQVYQLDAQGNPIPKSSNDKVTGINFFEVPKEKFRAALYLNLSKDIRDDLKNLTTALAPNKPGDNRIAIAISKLQHEKILDSGTTTLEEHYLDSIGRVGLESSKALLDYQQSEGILVQTKAIKERISGVSLDEEAANMVKFQHAFDASAKVMATADEMFRSVLAIMPT